MAKVTSARQRSRRSASKRPTSSKTRATRSKASNAKVTQSGKGKFGSAKVTRGSSPMRTSTGSAKVTGGTKPAPKTLPPSSKGGAMVKSKGGAMVKSSGGQVKTKGGSLGPKAKGPRGMRSRLSAGKGGALAKTKGGALAKTKGGALAKTKGGALAKTKGGALAKTGAKAGLKAGAKGALKSGAKGAGALLGPAALVAAGASTAKSLADSLKRGEGFARIPGLVKRAAKANNRANQSTSTGSRSRFRRSGGRKPATSQPMRPNNTKKATTAANAKDVDQTPYAKPQPRVKPSRNSGGTGGRSQSGGGSNKGSLKVNGKPGVNPNQKGVQAPKSSAKKYGVKGGNQPKGRTKRLEAALSEARKKKYTPKR